MKKITHKQLTHKKGDLLKQLPHRGWGVESEYDFIVLAPTGSKHDSGWGEIAIIGVNFRNKTGKRKLKYDYEAEIASICDDVCWNFPKKHPYDMIDRDYHRMILRTDCFYPSGLLRFWASREARFGTSFKVGTSLSSTDITLLTDEEKKDDKKTTAR